jgi:hypothetical protein
MKMEIEKERQKMIKEFKEMQDNLYCKRSYFIHVIIAMNKKSLNIPSTSEVNQNNEAPLDVFLKRLSRSSISQN